MKFLNLFILLCVKRVLYVQRSVMFDVILFSRGVIKSFFNLVKERYMAYMRYLVLFMG